MASMGWSYTLSSNRRMVAAIERVKAVAQDRDRLWEAFICPKGHRAVENNKRYWAILRQVGYETGHSPGDLHRHFAQEFLGVDLVWEPRYKKWEAPPFSTAVLGGKEFDNYLEQVMSTSIMEIGADLDFDIKVK